MKILSFISEAIIPLLVFYIVATGIARKNNVYEEFLKGAKDGLHVVVEIVPTLIGLMIGVGILRASGFLEFISNLFGTILAATSFPREILPLSIVKMFSSSAATGLLLDIYKSHGTDSLAGALIATLAGIVASVMLAGKM